MGWGVAAAIRGIREPFAGTAVVSSRGRNLNRRSPTKIGSQNPDRCSLLLISVKGVRPRRLAAVARFDRNCCPPKTEQYRRRQAPTGVPLGHSARG